MSVLRQRAKEIKLMRELEIPIANDRPATEKQPEPDDGSEPKEDKNNE
jgi:hypothetical protein